MTSEERNERIKKMFEDDLALLLRKGHDYSGDDDCMRNLRDFGFLGVVVRLGDKYHRLKSFVENKTLKVKDESVIDTLRDMRNYSYLAQILWEMGETGNLKHWNPQIKCAGCGWEPEPGSFVKYNGKTKYWKCPECDWDNVMPKGLLPK